MSLVLFSLDQGATARDGMISDPLTAVFSSIGDWRESETKATGFVIDTTDPLKGEAVPESASRNS